MIVIEQPRPEATPIPGIHHATWAGRQEGLTQLSLWRQTLAPGAATPPHSHVCEEVVLCLSGQGEVHIGGEVHCFGTDSTVLLPMNVVHQIFNTGTAPLEILVIFAATPVGAWLPDGQAIDLPWRS